MKLWLTVTIGFLSAFIFSPARAEHADYRTRNPRPPEVTYPACATRLIVAVDQFKTENVTLDDWNDDWAFNSREVAVDELLHSGCFRVVEREDRSQAPVGVMNEKKLARSSEDESESDEDAPRTPLKKKGKKTARLKEAKAKSKVGEFQQIEIADHLLTYAITALKKGGEGFHLGWLTGIAGAVLGGKGETILGNMDAAFSNDHLYLTCRIFDTSTSEIKASAQVKVKDTNVMLGFGGMGAGDSALGAAGLAYFKQSKAGKLIANAVHKCSIQLAKNLVREQVLQEVPKEEEVATVSPDSQPDEKKSPKEKEKGR
ncbi:MAG: CsgG/HfaB family protein [bacterium]